MKIKSVKAWRWLERGCVERITDRPSELDEPGRWYDERTARLLERAARHVADICASRNTVELVRHCKRIESWRKAWAEAQKEASRE